MLPAAAAVQHYVEQYTYDGVGNLLKLRHGPGAGSYTRTYQISVNATGRKIRKAFLWKAKGIKNEAILEKLRALGLKLNRQHLTKILKNPFYCGLIAHKFLEGKVIEGNQERLISQELVLQVNEISQQNSLYAVPHKKEQDDVLLKVFMRCSVCSAPFSGYVVKAKSLWYYKCRTRGCKCSRSARQMNGMFVELLTQYSLRGELVPAIQSEMMAIWQEVNKEGLEQEASLKAQLAVVAKKVVSLEEKYFLNGEMTKEVYDRFALRLSAEYGEIRAQLQQSAGLISNPEATIAQAIDLALKLAPTWASANFGKKEALQKNALSGGNRL